MAGKKLDQDSLLGIKTYIDENINNIEDLIPSQASEQNKLADKNFVNSSIATNTAYFKGTFNVVTDLGLTTEATQQEIATAIGVEVSNPTNNDYVFVSFPDETVPTAYTKFSRYKYNSGTGVWAFEFDLNNSSFTAEQWASINSGVTSEMLDDFITSAELAVIISEATKKMVSTTWSELKDLRDSGSLVPGTFYRITDYEFVYNLSMFSSAGHQFDIIVMANSKTELSEFAHACLHEGDEYFKYNNLSAWKIWYCLDNDKTRFDWANVNGKGVIYRMIDEFNNDCPYDFKNLLMNGKYTFSIGGDSYEGGILEDTSLNKNFNVHDNKISAGYASTIRSLFSCDNYFEGENIYSNKLKENCSANTFKTGCHDNVLGKSSRFNTFDIGCNSNVFGKNCTYNKLGRYCYDNMFGSECESNELRGNCVKNVFGRGCNTNTLTSNIGNTFGNLCYRNELYAASNNSFGHNCCSNNLSNNSDKNIFHNSCINISLFSSSTFNIFHNNCALITLYGGSQSYNTFGNNCDHIYSRTRLTCCKFEGNNQYLEIDDGDTAFLQTKNVNIHLGVSGSSVFNLRELVPTSNADYSIDYYAPNSQSVILDE